jgi:hypothetical protein
MDSPAKRDFLQAAFNVQRSIVNVNGRGVCHTPLPTNIVTICKCKSRGRMAIRFREWVMGGRSEWKTGKWAACLNLTRGPVEARLLPRSQQRNHQFHLPAADRCYLLH